MRPERLPHLTRSPALTRRAALALMFAFALASLSGFVAWGPVVLRPHVHELADMRVWSGLPSGLHVWTHLPLLPIGAWGLWRVSQLPSHEPLRAVWACFFVWQMAATLGGIVYHLHPDNLSYIADQVPRTGACLLFALAFVAERIDLRLGQIRGILVSMLLVALGTLWWFYTLYAWDGGDLRPLIWLEFLPFCMLAAGAWSLKGHLLSQQDWQRSLLSFALAQVLDWADRPIYAMTGNTISGHSLRHLALAACVGWVAWRIGRYWRTRVPEPEVALTRHQASETSFPDNRLAS